MELSFFMIENSSGYKTREKWFSINYPLEYSKINEYCSKLNINLSFKEKIWFYFNNLSERPKCKTCGKEIKFRNRLDKPYGEFCSLNCINSNKNEMSDRQKKTFNKNYGVDYYPKHKDFMEKQQSTKLKRYGDKNYTNLEKRKKTLLEKYNSENYVNLEKTKKTLLEKYGVDNFSKTQEFKNIIQNNYKKLYPKINILEVKQYDVDVMCDRCKKEFTISKQNLYERYKRKHIVCTYCNPIGQSSQSGTEDEICSFLEELNVNFIRSSRILKNKQEIDILLPEYNIGIELNGLYWHNELFVNDDYHLNKTIEAKNLGIDLIHIFEDEWNYNKEIVKSIIKNKLKKNVHSIFARKCEIKLIDSNESKKFLKENHIQGEVNSKVRIGLFYKEHLVSLMTFSKGRIIMGGKNDEWELNRFCNLINHNIVGSANKLLKYFILNYKPKKIISYSDKRMFNGGLYKKLGFTEKQHSSPNYHYVINGKRYYRFNFRKSILIKEGFDPNKTERQIMLDRKIYRIYDCGNIKWELTI